MRGGGGLYTMKFDATQWLSDPIYVSLRDPSLFITGSGTEDKMLA